MGDQINTGASFRVGIDPTGANDPNSPSIVWSGTTNPYTGFQQMTVDATASAGSVTVVLNASMTTPVRHQHVFWDTASLTAGGSGGTTTGGQPAQGAVSAVAAVVTAQGAQEDGSIVHTVQSGDTLAGIAVAYNITIPELLQLNNLTAEQARLIYPGQKLIVRAAEEGAGEAEPAESATEEQPAGEGETSDGSAEAQPPAETGEKPIEEYDAAPIVEASVPMLRLADTSATGQVCALLFDDVNPNRLRESGEALLAGGEIVLTQGGGQIGAHTTDGQNEPYCFGALTPGNYELLLTSPANYGPTTPSTYSLIVRAGQTVDVVFGAAQGFNPPQPALTQGGNLFAEPTTETEARQPLEQIMQYSGYIVLGLAGVVLLGGIVLSLLLRR